MPSPEYIREVVNEWASKQPQPKPLTDYERSILNEILRKQTANQFAEGKESKTMKQWPKNPRAPKAEFVTADFPRFTAYGWKCLKHGIVAFGNTEAEAIKLWFDAYRSEYGIG